MGSRPGEIDVSPTLIVRLVILALCLLGSSPAAHAQPGPKIPRIGMLGRTPASAGSFLQALRDLGYREGQTIAIESRWTEGQLDRLPDLAAELVRLQPALLVAISHRVAMAAKAATTTIPIVFLQVNDPVGVGLVASLAHPGANVTGVSLQGLDLIGKRLQLLREALPWLAHVAYLRNPTEPYSAAYWREVQGAARALGVNRLVSLEVRRPEEFEEAFAELVRLRPDAVLVEPNALNWTYRRPIAAVTVEHRLPTMSGETGFAEAGALMSYGPSLPDHVHRAAVLVDKILKGAKPADLPVEQPTTFELVINLKTAQALDLMIPPTLLFQATRVIR
jgi:putative tryptophan/tyrosine transport system substrate-binding protein